MNAPTTSFMSQRAFEDAKAALVRLQQMWSYADDITRNGRTFGATPGAMREWASAIAKLEQFIAWAGYAAPAAEAAEPKSLVDCGECRTQGCRGRCRNSSRPVGAGDGNTVFMSEQPAMRPAIVPLTNDELRWACRDAEHAGSPCDPTSPKEYALAGIRAFCLKNGLTGGTA